MNKDLSIIIPAYLEEENLRIILPRLNKVLGDLKMAHEVLVVDTVEPKDNTGAVCAEHGATCLNRSGGNSYGDAIRTGIANAKGEFTIFMDADGSHAPEFIANLMEHRNDYDVVVASRYIDGGNTDNNKTLIFMSLVVNVLYSVLLNIDCKDVSNSFKLYKTADIKALKLKCSNFDIVEEILYKLKRQKGVLKIKEVPFVFKKRMFGNTKRNLFLFVLSYAATIIKLRFSK